MWISLAFLKFDLPAKREGVSEERRREGKEEGREGGKKGEQERNGSLKICNIQFFKIFFNF
jgi:hypothetical protein